MLLRTCLICKFHECRLVDGVRISYCQRENCYSRYSKCIANKALNRFLEQDSRQTERPDSALSRFYPRE